MLKRIDVSDVELGMFVHKLEGSWFKHPFWKSRFLLNDKATLQSLQTSEVDAVIIDTDKGLDLRPLSAHPAGQGMAKPAAPARGAASRKPRIQSTCAPRRGPQQSFGLRATGAQTMAQEFGNAQIVAGQSRKVVSRIFLEARLGRSIKAAQVSPVIEDIFCSIQRNPHAFNGLMRCKRENEYVYRHALAVSALMIALARQMKMRPDEIRAAGMAGMLMDVGIGHLPVDLASYGGDYRNVPDEIFRQHVHLGANSLQFGGDMPEAVLDVCMQHHETLDGTGYPAALKGKEISLFARMAAICDTFDSMVSDTAEGVGMNPASAIEQMSYLKGWFDQTILQHFVATMGIFPIGSVVLLRSGRLAMVVDQFPDDLHKPVVRVFYSVAEKRAVRPQILALGECFGEDDIVRSVDVDDYDIPDFQRLRQTLFAGAAKG